MWRAENWWDRSPAGGKDSNVISEVLGCQIVYLTSRLEMLRTTCSELRADANFRWNLGGTWEGKKVRELGKIGRCGLDCVRMEEAQYLGYIPDPGNFSAKTIARSMLFEARVIIVRW